MSDYDKARVPGMPTQVAEQITEYLAEGEKVLAALATAAHLITATQNADSGLRLAESAAYNIREALDGVTAKQNAPPSGMPAVNDALKRFRASSASPEVAELEALQALADDLLALEAAEQLGGKRERQLLAWLEERTGIRPITGPGSVPEQLATLRTNCNEILHRDGDLLSVADLYQRAIDWFVRVFTPPGDRIRAIVQLAHSPFEDQHQIAELRARLYNDHHLRRFLIEVRDPEWLDALLSAGLISAPRPDEPWGLTALASNTGGITAAQIAELLHRVRERASKGDAETFAAVDREIILLCFRAGPDPALHAVIASVVRKRPHDHWVRRVAGHSAEQADPSDALQEAVADAVFTPRSARDSEHLVETISARLTAGLTAENALRRMSILSYKLAKLADTPRAQIYPLDIVALNSAIGDDDRRDERSIIAQQFASAIPTARALGLTSSELCGLVAPIPGELGERLMCRVLADAPDISRAEKLDHLCTRVASATATGDDADLLARLGELSADEREQLTAAFGQPTAPAVGEPHGALPPEWDRAWHWSMIVPPNVLKSWDHAIAAVTEVHGAPDVAALQRRLPKFFDLDPSPYTSEQLGELPPLDAAKLVAQWRAGPDRLSWRSTVYDLAGTLEQAITAEIDAWTENPPEIVAVLREPVYIQRYLRAIERNAKTLLGQTAAIMAMVDLIWSRPWDPARITDDVDDQAWTSLNGQLVKLLGAFANAEADFGASLGLVWEITDQVARALPEQLPDLPESHDPTDHNDPYGTAINRTYGQALETAMSLGWLGHRRDLITPPQLVGLLDWALTIPGEVGAELRSVIAVLRPVLEHCAIDWIETRHHGLFTGREGEIAFEATLKYPQAPTPWLYRNYQQRIFRAACDGVPNAVALPLIGYLSEVEGYTAARILGSYRRDERVLRQTAEDLATLAQGLHVGDPELQRALAFWDAMLDAADATVPASALAGAGRWVHHSSVARDELLHRFERTVELTDGNIDSALEVAELCRDTQPNRRALVVLTRMQGRGEIWERQHCGEVGVQALRAAAGHGLGAVFDRLRDRLVEYGFHDAASIKDAPPPE